MTNDHRHAREGHFALPGPAGRTSGVARTESFSTAHRWSFAARLQIMKN